MSRPRYRTGDAHLDEAIAGLVAATGRSDDADLVFECLVSVVRMAREHADRGDLKLVNSTLKELRYADLVFDGYRGVPKVSIFGSARTTEADPAYRLARDFGTAMAEADWMVITGAGPGIMAAGIEGAGADRAFGVNILLPFEAAATEHILGDPKLINFRYFFTRKLTFLRESHGFCLFPGGFGTMDEAFELLTLMQTGRTPLAPVVLLEPEGSTYWQSWQRFVADELAARGLVSEDDLCLARICTTVEEARDELTGFYRTFHSQRTVGRRLILRLRREVPDAELEALAEEFADIIERGGIERVVPSQPEVDDDDHIELPRIALRFDRWHFTRLRQLIDRLNQAGGQAETNQDMPADVL
jgi:uncharacterized protein (TIGR00730 family)